METRKIGSLEVTAAGLDGNAFGDRDGVARTRAVVEAAIAREEPPGSCLFFPW
jgi:hypothetical protein